MYYLRFKDKDKSAPNLMISTMKITDKLGNYLVEFWDVTTNYYHLKLDEETLIKNQEYLKTLNKDSTEYKELNNNLVFHNKYRNKRKFIHKDDFDNMFEIISKIEK